MKKVTNTSKTPKIGWLGGGNPNAILAQEEQGQRELIESDQLPAQTNYPRGLNTALQYESMGIKVIGNTEGDDLFLDVVLPTGWKKEATDHSMWNKLKDDKGRVRATFFYKAAFYDRKAMVNFIQRYNIEEQYYEQEKNPEVEWDCARNLQVIDSTTEAVLFEGEKYFSMDAEAKAKAKIIAHHWLAENYPKWEDYNAYWD